MSMDEKSCFGLTCCSRKCLPHSSRSSLLTPNCCSTTSASLGLSNLKKQLDRSCESISSPPGRCGGRNRCTAPEALPPVLLPNSLVLLPHIIPRVLLDGSRLTKKALPTASASGNPWPADCTGRPAVPCPVLVPQASPSLVDDPWSNVLPNPRTSNDPLCTSKIGSDART
jgi:hypothetical protein